jgi:hypothetical protein
MLLYLKRYLPINKHEIKYMAVLHYNKHEIKYMAVLQFRYLLIC